jgi:hypothetical protein
LSNPKLAELSSLGLINPLEIVWEVLRYSFVVDWFLPVGEWLGSLTADVGYTFYGGSLSKISRMVEVPYTFQIEDVTYGGIRTRVINGTSFNCHAESYNFVRTCYGSSPVPGLHFKNPLSALHMMNGLSLLVQAFKR